MAVPCRRIRGRNCKSNRRIQCLHCYDADNASIGNLRARKDRLIAIHMHDNDGSGDQHLLPFRGTVDWNLLTGIIAQSSYKKCVSLETGMKNYKETAEKRFLSDAFEAGTRLSEMIATASERGTGGSGS